MTTLLKEGYELGIVFGRLTLHIDVQFNRLDLSDLLRDWPLAEKFTVLDGMLRLRIHVPVQHIGFELQPGGYWAGKMDAEETLQIQSEATEFVRRAPRDVICDGTYATKWDSRECQREGLSTATYVALCGGVPNHLLNTCGQVPAVRPPTLRPLDLAAFTNKAPSWLPGQTKEQSFLDWILKHDKVGIWPLVADKVALKVDELSLKKLGATTRGLLLAAASSWGARAIYSTVAKAGIANTTCP
jgi:hypothetical protein